MAKKKIKLSNIIFASAPIFLGLAILWNQSIDYHYDFYIGIAAIIIAIAGILKETLK